MTANDNGSELTSNAIPTWADRTKINWHDIAPDKRMQIALIEFFNVRLRGEF